MLKRTYASARDAARRRGRANRASTYIHHAEDNIRPGDLVVLCVRVSTRGQKEHLPDQEKLLREFVESRGAKIVGVVSKVATGYLPRSWLRGAVRTARRLGAKLLAYSSDRFIRPPAYDAPRNATAIELDFEELLEIVGDVPLVTLLHPDTPLEELSKHRSDDGHGKGSTRRQSKNIRLEKIEMVLQMHAEGVSLRQIETSTGVPKSTVARWIKTHG